VLQYVEHPNLPNGRVRLIIVGARYLETLCLDRWGIQTVALPDDSALDAPVRAHTDMQVTHLYRENFLSKPADNCKVGKLYNDFLQNLCCKGKNLVETSPMIQQGKTVLQTLYPVCATYNVLLLGKYAIYNPKCIDSVLKIAIEQHGYEPVFVRQGFARCSVCVVREDAVITADAGIAAALRARGVDVLQIAPGGIDLPGYDTGFIGGASFKLAPDLLAFTGRIDAHPNADEIDSFLKAHGVEYIALTGAPVFDIGTAIPVVEDV